MCTSDSLSGTAGRRSVCGSCRGRARLPVRNSGAAASSEAVALRTTILDLERETNAYRVVHAEGDGLSGLIVDRYDDVLSVEVFSLGIYQRIGPILSLCAERLGTTHYRVGVDERVAQQEDFSGRPLASPRLPPRVTVQEHGIRYRIHFDEGHKTGFFCDQRDSRRELARFCAGRAVLDLCCYTGGFGLNALIRGQAREVTCVDLDEKAVALARENGNANNVRLDVVHADAFGYARQMAQNGKSYGVVVLDPPKLILDRDEISAGKRKYFDLNVLAMKLIEKGGLLVTCSCSGLLGPQEFLGLLGAAAQRRARGAAPGIDRRGAPTIRWRSTPSKAPISRWHGCASAANRASLERPPSRERPIPGRSRSKKETARTSSRRSCVCEMQDVAADRDR